MSADVIGLVVNGEARSIAVGSSIAEWLRSIELDPRTVAIERNGEIVPRARFEETFLAEGDHLELVHFVQGG